MVLFESEDKHPEIPTFLSFSIHTNNSSPLTLLVKLENKKRSYHVTPPQFLCTMDSLLRSFLIFEILNIVLKKIAKLLRPEQNAKVYSMLFGENRKLKKQLEDYHFQSNTLKRRVKKLEKDVRSLKDELKDLDEYIKDASTLIQRCFNIEYLDFSGVMALQNNVLIITIIKRSPNLRHIEISGNDIDDEITEV
ncbi:4536_t:CDS:2, partial [Funneliformis geosporum]